MTNSIFTTEDLFDENARLEAENFSLRAEIKKLKAEARAADNAWVELGAIHEAMVDAIEGREPSDFMLSFPEVRAAWDLRLAANMLMAAEGDE